MRDLQPGRYQAQECGLSLAQGLAEYYWLNPHAVTHPDRLAPESAALFRRHDICHVIFGLSTSLEDETLADVRTVLATDVGLGRYLDYLRTDQQAKALFAELGLMRAAGASLRALPRVARSLAERLRMPRPWPWKTPDAFLDRPLADLRREYRIRVL